jgi:diacylglycerol kinase (ATP)
MPGKGKAILIVNPTSGTNSAPDHLAAIETRLRDRFDSLEIVITTAEGDARDAGARVAAEGGVSLFVAGGDGTLNEALNGVAAVPNGLASVVFGVIPLGTGNDFATALGIPESIDDALDVLLGGEPIAVDVGRLNDRHFVNVSAGGFIAEVSDAVDPQLKTVAGRLAYLLGGVQVLLEFEPFHVRLHIPGGAESDPPSPRLRRGADLLTFAVCNSRLIGGGRLIAPDARVDDGALDVCLIHAMPTLEFVALLRRVSEGSHVDDDRVTYLRRPALDIEFDRPVKVNTDGEVLEADRCSYRVLPRAARFLGRRTETDIVEG